MEAGYSIAEPLFEDEECERIATVLSDVAVSLSRVSARHLMGVPEVAQFARDRRLLDLANAAELLGCVL